jgi:hypothetical protein
VPFADNLDADLLHQRLPRGRGGLVGAWRRRGVVFQALLRTRSPRPTRSAFERGRPWAMLAITFHLTQIAGLLSIPLASLAGSLFALAVV